MCCFFSRFKLFSSALSLFRSPLFPFPFSILLVFLFQVAGSVFYHAIHKYRKFEKQMQKSTFHIVHFKYTNDDDDDDDVNDNLIKTDAI